MVARFEVVVMMAVRMIGLKRRRMRRRSKRTFVILLSVPSGSRVRLSVFFNTFLNFVVCFWRLFTFPQHQRFNKYQNKKLYLFCSSAFSWSAKKHLSFSDDTQVLFFSAHRCKGREPKSCSCLQDEQIHSGPDLSWSTRPCKTVWENDLQFLVIHSQFNTMIGHVSLFKHFTIHSLPSNWEQIRCWE